MISSILCSCLLDLDGQTHTHISVYMHVPPNACMVHSTASHVRALPPACWPAWADTHTPVYTCMYQQMHVCFIAWRATCVLYHLRVGLHGQTHTPVYTCMYQQMYVWSKAQRATCFALLATYCPHGQTHTSLTI